MEGALAWFAPLLRPGLTALAILVVAWVSARALRALVLRVGRSVRIDDRLRSPGITQTLAGVATGLIWLLALPALLGALQLEALLVPVNAMMTRLLAFVPNLFGAAVVFGIGLVVAGVVRQVVTGLLKAAGSERLAERLGVARALGEGGLAGIAGGTVFALVMLPVLAASLQPLGLDAVTQPVSKLVETVMSLIPRLIAGAVIVALGAVLGRALANIVQALLASMGFDSVPSHLGLGDGRHVSGRTASELAGSVAMVGVVFVALTQACEVIGFAALTQTVATLGLALAQIVVGLAVLAVGLWLATAAARGIRASGVAHAAVLGNLARAAVLFFAAALALHQMGLPPEIVAIAFAAVVGALAVGVAIAFGLGGQRVAGVLLERAVAAFDKRPDAVVGTVAAPEAPEATADRRLP